MSKYKTDTNSAVSRAPAFERVQSKGRKRKWEPERADSLSTPLLERLEKEYFKKSKTPERIRKEFESFLILNSLDLELDPDLAFRLLVEQMLQAGLMVSSIDTFLGYIAPTVRRSWKAKLAFLRVARVISLAHADADARTAPLGKARCIRRIWKKATGIHSLVFLLLAMTGGRWADLQRLRKKQISLDRDKLHVQFRIRKNARTRDKRKTLHVPLHWFSDIASWDELSFLISRFCRRGSKDDFVFSKLPLEKINGLSKSLSRGFLKEGERAYTTYSYRIFYMNRVYKYAEEEKLDISNFSMHQDKKIIEAFYLRLETNNQESE